MLADIHRCEYNEAPCRLSIQDKTLAAIIVPSCFAVAKATAIFLTREPSDKTEIRNVISDMRNKMREFVL